MTDHYQLWVQSSHCLFLDLFLISNVQTCLSYGFRLNDIGSCCHGCRSFGFCPTFEFYLRSACKVAWKALYLTGLIQAFMWGRIFWFSNAMRVPQDKWIHLFGARCVLFIFQASIYWIAWGYTTIILPCREVSQSTHLQMFISNTYWRSNDLFSYNYICYK